MGNGAKAQMKRERNAKGGGGEAKSQLKSNQKAMNVQCSICKQPFMLTVKKPALMDHVNSKVTLLFE